MKFTLLGRLLLAFGCVVTSAGAGTITAHFEGGAGTSATDQVPGVAGSGWTGPWSTGTLSSTNTAFTAASTSPLTTSGGQYLRAVITATNTDSGVGRPFTNNNGTTGVDGTKPVTISFDFRLDASNAGFTGSNEHITLNGNSDLVSSSGSTTWLIRLVGGSNPVWQFYNGGRDGGSFNSSLLVSSGMNAVPGVTYTFKLSITPATRTYSITLTNGSSTVTVNNLGFRTSSTVLGNTFGVFAKKDSSADMLAFALDRIEISGETPPPTAPLATFPYVFDMVHHNPGEARYDSLFNDPVFTRNFGFSGKVYYLFDSPHLAVNWDEFDTPDKVILPVGSPDRAWVDAKRADLNAKFDAANAAGLKIYAMSDLILFPKRLVSLYGLSSTFGNINNADTELWLRRNLRLMFAQFPKLDGIVVRIGETYLNDAPYHQGKIDNPTSTTTITPLMNILRDEVCVKLNKKIFFRTWFSFDTNVSTFLAVSNAVEPHPNLIWSIKHVEGDFHRGNPFSKVMGQGRHPFIVEVQCAREYEGKGAFPNYIANGVIEGFEEHSSTENLRALWQNSPLMVGVWTWSRGGGWKGPYIKNELWCELNAWVMAQWALSPSTSEEALFNRFASERLGLPSAQIPAFRRLCLLSAEAVWRWKRGTNNGLTAGWSRDQYYTFPNLPTSSSSRATVLSSEDDAVARFEEIVAIARTLTPADPADREFILSSSLYGLRLLRMMRSVVNLKAAELDNDGFRTKVWMDHHDEAWTDYLALADEYPNSASTFYIRNAWQTWGGENPITAEPRVRTVAENTFAAYSATDRDGDGVSDAVELGRYWDQPFDTDGDGKPDYQEAGVTPRAYDLWTQAFFLRRFSETALASPAADPDGDGHPNLLEYLLLGDPGKPDNNLFTFSMGPATGGVSLQFDRNHGATDSVLTVQESSDLVFWHSVARSTAGAAFDSVKPGWTIDDPSTGLTRVASPESATATRRFLRIETSIIPR
jgi:hypothetical protein